MSVKERYIENNFNILKRLFPDKDQNQLKKLIESKYKEKIKDPTINLDNNVTGENRDITLTTLGNWIECEKPIISGNATFYLQPSILKSPTSNMLHTMKFNRSQIKKTMFGYDPKSQIYLRKDLEQQNLKVIMNAEYGGSGTPTAAFYSIYSPAATTLMAQSMITTAAAFFESFLGNNQKIYNINELFDWIKCVLNKTIDIDSWVKTPTKEEVTYRIKSLFINYDLMNNDLIDHYINSLINDELIKLYYANNINEFIKRHHKPQSLIKSILSKLPNLEAVESIDQIPIDKQNEFKTVKEYNDYMSKLMFLNPYDVPESIKNDLDQLSDIIIKYCYVDYITPDSIMKLNNHKRNTVLLVDTDSNVINANLFVTFVLDTLFPNDSFGRSRLYNDMICINIIASILSTGIALILKYYCKLHNFDPSNWGEIKMKNEFMFRVFFIMLMKKRYAASIVLREGHMMVPFKLEIKGMDFIKASVSSEVTNRYTNILKDNILYSNTPNLHGLMKDSKQFERDIYDSIKHGFTTYYKTQVFKDSKGYKNPDDAWRLQVYRGVMIWNLLYPLKKIYSLDRVKIIKLIVKDPSDLESIRFTDPDIYNKIIKDIFNSPNPELQKAGLKVIAVPLSLKQLPDWITKLVDVQIAISNITASFGSVFKVLRIQSLGVNTPNDKAILYSPIIAI